MDLNMDTMEQTPTPAPSPAQASKRCSMACTTCRQVKLRCDAAQRYPSPCTRCEKRRKTCVFDSEFKRRPVRGALERLLEEKEQLKQIVDSLNNNNNNHSSGGRLSQDPQAITPSNNSQPSPTITVSAHGSACSADETPGYDLDGTHLSLSMVNNLFQHFIAIYLPILPILDIDRKPVATVWADSELLFWTILVTAAQNHPTHRSSAFEALVRPYRRLLADALVQPARTIYMTQALLVVTVWPLPTDLQRNDPSWYYCGLAVSLATLLRLHEAESSWWYSSAGDKEEVSGSGGNDDPSARYKTWLGCFLVSNTLATDMGLPPLMAAVNPLAPSILKLVEASLPYEFVARLEFQNVLFRSYSVLKDCAVAPNLSPQNPLLDVLERELDAFEQKWSTASTGGERRPLSLLLRLDLLGARLRLRAPFLTPRSGSSSSSSSSIADPDVFVQAAWHKSVDYAGQIVQLMTDFLLDGSVVDDPARASNGSGSGSSSSGGSSGNTRPPLVIAAEKHCLPKHYYRTHLTAIFVLLIFVMLHRRKSGGGSENGSGSLVIASDDAVWERARVYTRQSPDIVHALSRHPTDENGRCSRFLRLVSHYVDDDSLAAEFARAVKPPVTDIIDMGVKATWVIRRRIAQKYLEGPDRELPRRTTTTAAGGSSSSAVAAAAVSTVAGLPAATAGRTTMTTRSSTAAAAATGAIAVTPHGGGLATQDEMLLYDQMQPEQQQHQQQHQQPMPVPYVQGVGQVPPGQEAAPQQEGDVPYLGQEYELLGFSEELFTDWNTWFNNADDFMSLFRAPSWNPM